METRVKSEGEAREGSKRGERGEGREERRGARERGEQERIGRDERGEEKDATDKRRKGNSSVANRNIPITSSSVDLSIDAVDSHTPHWRLVSCPYDRGGGRRVNLIPFIWETLYVILLSFRRGSLLKSIIFPLSELP